MMRVLKTSSFGIFEISYDNKIVIRSEGGFEMEPNFIKSLVTSYLTAQSITFYPTKLDGELNDVLTFASQIPNAIQIEKKARELHQVDISVQDLKTRIQSIDFERLLQNSMNPLQWILVKDRLAIDSFLDEDGWLDGLIASTTPEVLANFLFVQSIVSSFKLTFVGLKYCSMHVSQKLPQLALGVMYHHYFDKRNLDKASEIVTDIQAAFQKMLESSTWLQESTKKNALKKLDKMRKVVGYPGEFTDIESMEQRFEREFDWNPTDTLYDFYAKMSMFQRSINIDEAASGQTFVSTFQWTMINAFYSPYDNAIMLTIPILDDPIFDVSFPKFAQLASIGPMVGHELGHGFDPNGARFDENGKANNWWTSQDQQEFQERAQCVIEKYENHDDPSYGKQLNGVSTIGENVADLLGNQVSWNVYKTLDTSKNQKIVGFEDYNTDKLFFRIVASKFCSPYNTEPLTEILKDPHGVFNYRVNGVFSNMKEFADTFNCPVGSKMNPATKCPIF